MRMVRSDIDDVNLDVAEKIGASLDLTLNRVQDVGRQVAHDDRVEHFIANSAVEGVDYYANLYRVRILTNNILFHTKLQIHSIYLISNAKRRIYSSHSTSFSTAEYDDPELLHTVLDGSTEQLWSRTRISYPAWQVHDGRQERLIAFIQGYPMLTFNKTGFVQVNLREDVFFRVIDRLRGDVADSFLIVDGDGNVVSRRAGAGTYAGVDDVSMVEIIPPGVSSTMARVTIDGVSSVVFAVRSDVNDWTYMSVIETREYARGYLRYQRFLILLCFAVLVLVLPFVYLQAKNATRPLSKFVAQVKSGSARESAVPNATGSDSDALTLNSLSELDELSAVFSSLSLRVESLLEETSHDRELWWLRNLLMDGSFARLFAREHQHYAESFPYRRFFVLLFSSGVDNEAARVLVHAALEGQTAFRLESVPLAGGSVCVIANVDEDVERKALVEGIRAAADREAPPELTVGRTVSSLEKVSLSFADAERLRELNTYKHDVSLVNYAGVQDQMVADGYELFQRLDRLSSVLRGLDRSAVRTQIDEIFARMESSYVSSEMVRYLVMELCFRLFHFLQDRNVTTASLTEEVNGFLRYFHELRSLAVVKDFVGRVYDRAISLVSGRRTKALHRELIAEALSYIEDHLGDRELSLQLVADALDTGLSNLSRLFKAETGRNFSTYVATRRIELAKELLAGGKDDYVRDVAERVGYDNTHSFSRVFRRFVGVSPSYYRERARLTAERR